MGGFSLGRNPILPGTFNLQQMTSRSKPLNFYHRAALSVKAGRIEVVILLAFSPDVDILFPLTKAISRERVLPWDPYAALYTAAYDRPT